MNLTEMLRSYAQIIEAGELNMPLGGNPMATNPNMGGMPPVPPPIQSNQNADMTDMEHPDEDTVEQSDDPIRELSSAIAEAHSTDESDVYAAIEAFLKSHKYEITPLNSLANDEGNI